MNILINILFHWHLIAGVLICICGLLFKKYIFHENTFSLYEDRIILIGTICLTIILTTNKIFQYLFCQNQAFDLGIFTNVLYNTLQGRWFYNNLLFINHLSDHFSPALLIFVPFFYLFKSPLVLTIGQSVILSLCLPLTYFLSRQVGFSRKYSFCFALLFVCNPYFHNMHVHDFHLVVFSAPLFLLLLLMFFKKKWSYFWIISLIILLIREDAALVLVSFNFWIILFEKKYRKIGIINVIISGVYCAVVLFIVMPFLRKQGNHYSLTLFSTFIHALISIFDGKLDVFIHYIFTIIHDGKRIMPIVYILGTFGFLPFFSKKYLLLLLIPFAINLFSDFQPMYQITSHYSSLLLPFLFLSSLKGIQMINKMMFVKYVSSNMKYVFFLFSISLFLFSLKPYIIIEPLNIVSSRWKAIQLIPQNAAVSAQINMIPQLCMRQNIRIFPDVVEASYVVLDLQNQAFKIPYEFQKTADNFEKFNMDMKIYDNCGVKVFCLK